MKVKSREQKKSDVFNKLHKEEIERIISSGKDDYQEHDNSLQVCTYLVKKNMHVRERRQKIMDLVCSYRFLG